MELPEHEAATFIPSAGEVLPLKNRLVSTPQPVNRKDKPPSSYPVSSSSRSPPDLSDWGERVALWRRWFGVRRERVFP